MLVRNRSWPVALILGAALLATPGIAAQSAEATPHAVDQDSVLLTVRLGRLVDGERRDVKSYRIVIVTGGPGSRLLSGARMPIPTTSRDPDAMEEDDAGMTEFVYQNIGFSTEVRAWILPGDRIKLAASIEDSRLGEPAGDDPPPVETRQLSVNAILAEGVPLEVTRVEGINDSSGFVELEAKILR